jgi:RNA polymerase sigma factor (sigma-70 family)
MGDGSTMAESERDLVRQLQGGERAALEALYRRYVERVWRYAFARTRDREVAADVVQDTFLRVWQRIGTFRGRAQFSTWLFAVARSALVDEVRRRRRASGADASRLDPETPRVLRLAVMDDAPVGAAALGRRRSGSGRSYRAGGGARRGPGGDQPVAACSSRSGRALRAVRDEHARGGGGAELGRVAGEGDVAPGPQAVGGGVAGSGRSAGSCGRGVGFRRGSRWWGRSLFRLGFLCFLRPRGLKPAARLGKGS